MSQIVRCDGCRQDFLGEEIRAFWIVVQAPREDEPMHFCAWACLRAWLERVHP